MKKRRVLLWGVLGIVVMGMGVVGMKTMTILKSRAMSYHYDVATDYHYEFNQSRASIFTCSLKGGVVTLPDGVSLAKTTLLKLHIDTTWKGEYLQPSITLSSQEDQRIAYLERGAKGIRYLNLSHLGSDKRKTIKLQGEYVTIKDQQVSVICFEKPKQKNPTIMVLAPHPDDAEIAAFGLYSESNRSYVVTITAGDAGAFMYDELYRDPVRHYLKKGELRTWDSLMVPRLGGVSGEQIVNLGFFDGTLAQMYQDQNHTVVGRYTKIGDISTYRKQNSSLLSKGLVGEANWRGLVDNLSYLLQEIRPDIIVTPYPLIDNHPDHQLTTVALLEAIKKVGLVEGSLYLYTNHFRYTEYYPYGDEGGSLSLPPALEADTYFDALYSYPLSSVMQKSKLLALEAMHDLRLDTQWRSPLENYRLGWKQLREQAKGIDDSYFRRGVRANELFFVIDIANLSKTRVKQVLSPRSLP